MNTVEDFIIKPSGTGTHQVFFTNVHTIHLARKDREFRDVVNHANIVLPDGSGLKVAGKLFKRPIVENLNGTDFVPRVVRKAAAHGWSVYLLGGTLDVTKECRRRWLEQYPMLKIVGLHHGHFALDEEEAILDDINAKRPDILLVALGSPLQEMWIARHASELKTSVSIAVGGLFDFISGQRKRAPRWMRRVGLEWVYRFFQDPRTKWTRVFIEIPAFIILILIQSLMPRGTRQTNVPNGYVQ
jgi:N-acetylglucosaminyldiphosphoundecaprenol N-acetyl-beta-D-mannosaminyltransferase